jgi:hypothetical protein
MLLCEAVKPDKGVGFTVTRTVVAAAAVHEGVGAVPTFHTFSVIVFTDGFGELFTQLTI